MKDDGSSSLALGFRSLMKHKDQSPKTKDRSSLYANHLLDLSDNFNQIVLVLHYRFN